MSRRPLAPRAGEVDRRANRMALGGRLKSESRIVPFWRPTGVAGEVPVVMPPEGTLEAFRFISWFADPDPTTGEGMPSGQWFGFQTPTDCLFAVVTYAHNVTSLDNLGSFQGAASFDPHPGAVRVASGMSGFMRWAVWQAPWTGGVPPGAGRGTIIQYLTPDPIPPLGSGSTVHRDQQGGGVVFRWEGTAATLNVQSNVQSGGSSTTWPTVPAGWANPIQYVAATPVNSVGMNNAAIDDTAARNGRTTNSTSTGFTGTGFTYRIGTMASGTLSDLNTSANNVWLRLVLGWT